MKFNNFFLKIILILLNSFIYFFLIDFSLTKLYGLKGYAEFFESSKKVGYINKRNFRGRFGGPLDEFSNIVNIDSFGNRYSTIKDCENINSSNQTKQKILFVGDSALAGFEVSDDKTYTSLLNENCRIPFLFINGGVRGHDTHMAMANLVRLIKEKNLESKDTRFFYMLTSNDFKENNNKNSYLGMKANFGSIYDSTFYKPYMNPYKMKFKNFLANNFYFLKKFRRYLITLNYDFNKDISNSKENININNQKTLDCERVIQIVSKTISKNKSIEKIYIISHPGLSNKISFLKGFKEQENCLQNASIADRRIIVVKISDQIEEIFKNRKSNSSLKFKRDSHYNHSGHLMFAEILSGIFISN